MSNSGIVLYQQNARLIGTGSHRTVIVSSVSSDAHTWNLVYLQLLIEELGFTVVNLGPCVPVDLLVAECVSRGPAMVVISSVNGHGYQDGMRAIEALRAVPELATVPMVIGGKLDTSPARTESHIDDLMAAGFDAVFDDRATDPASFTRFVAAISSTEPQRLGAGDET